MKVKFARGFLACASVLALSCVPALAQSAPKDGDEKAAAASAADEIAGEEAKQDIVVTGTLIRGVAPAGTNVVSLSKDLIEATGVVSTNQLLSRITQNTGFNDTFATAVPNAGAAITIVRPNLRNLGAAGGTATLVLVDGHRIANAGILTASPDPDVVPPAMIERVEIVPDGGSSIYGADAIGGVMNFITRRSFSGLELSARLSSAGKYSAFDANVTAGKTWDGGGAYLSYAFADSTAIYGRDLDYVRQISPSTACAPGTITIGTTNYRMSDRVAGTTAQCDPTDDTALYPDQRRHSLFAGVNQTIGSVDFDVKGYFTHRETRGRSAALTTSNLAIPSTNYYFQPIGTETSQNVAFSFGSALGINTRNDTDLDEWGVTSTAKVDLGSNWQLRVLGNVGGSLTTAHQGQINNTALSAAAGGTTAATALNPYNIAATNPAVLAAIADAEDYGRAKQRMLNARAILEGALFQLPGGDVRLATGVEILREDITIARGTVSGRAYLTAPSATVNRTTKAVFGEVVVPLVGSGNAMSFVHALTLSASARYDHYSDFGGTFNPKVGLTYNPVEWIAIRGNYGTSFNAPSMVDKAGAVDTRAQIIPISPFRAPDSPNPPAGFDLFRPTILLAGGNPNLGPQTAKTYELGVQIDPPFIPGLSLGATYFNIKLKDQIALAPFFNPSQLYSGTTWQNYYRLNPDLAYATAATAGMRLDGAPSIASLYAGPVGPYVLVDARRNNLGQVHLDGIDFSLNYTHPVSFGSVNFSFSGTYDLSHKTAPIAGQPFSDDLQFGLSRFKFNSSIGGTAGRFGARASLAHSQGFDILPGTAGTQTHVGSYDVVDLFFSYNARLSEKLKEVTFTFNVGNLFNTAPPFFNNGNGYANGSTLGRQFQLGARTKF